MYHKLNEDSVRVIDGKLYKPDGVLLYDPSILVLGGLLLREL